MKFTTPEGHLTHKGGAIRLQGQLDSALVFINGDALEVMRHLGAGAVDVVMTSPPYNLGVRYRSYDDAIPRAAYLAWSLEWLRLAFQVLSGSGSLFLNMGSKPSDPWGPDEVGAQARAAGFVLQNRVAWVKSVTVEGPAGAPLSVGHFKPLSSPRFLNDTWEPVYHFTKDGEVAIDRLAIGVPFADKSNIARFGAEGRPDRRCRGNVWWVPYETIRDRETQRPHPATFPPRLAEMCYRLHGLERIRWTLDPFSGLGASARAAGALGINHLAVELDEIDHRKAAALARETLDAMPLLQPKESVDT